MLETKRYKATCANVEGSPLNQWTIIDKHTGKIIMTAESKGDAKRRLISLDDKDFTPRPAPDVSL